MLHLRWFCCCWEPRSAAVWWAAAGGAAGFYRASRAARWFLLASCGMAVSLASLDAGLRESGAVAGQAVTGDIGAWSHNSRRWASPFWWPPAARGEPGRLRVLLRALRSADCWWRLYGIAQYFGWDPLLDARGYHVGEGIWTIVRPPSTLGHADYSANWLLFVVFAGAALATVEQHRSLEMAGVGRGGGRLRCHRAQRHARGACWDLAAGALMLVSLARSPPHAPPGSFWHSGSRRRPSFFTVSPPERNCARGSIGRSMSRPVAHVSCLARQPAHGGRALARGLWTGDLHRYFRAPSIG